SLAALDERPTRTSRQPPHFRRGKGEAKPLHADIPSALCPLIFCRDLLEPLHKRIVRFDGQINCACEGLAAPTDCNSNLPISPKHSASTGTQQPNTADSQGPADLDFINEFQCNLTVSTAGKSAQERSEWDDRFMRRVWLRLSSSSRAGAD